MLEYVKIWEAWIKFDIALHTRYEDLLTNFETQTDRLITFLGLDRKREALENVIEKYSPGNTQTDLKGLHFSRGKIGRFRQEMTLEQQKTLARSFKEGTLLTNSGHC